MRIERQILAGGLVVLAVAVSTFSQRTSGDDGGSPKVAMIDDCDPADPRWAPVGCFQKRGDVTRAEFDALAFSSLSLSTVGHPSWRNDPAYLTLEEGKDLRVANEGGRPHTFTEVAEFGGGRVPPLNRGLTPAPECQLPPGTEDPSEVAPGERKRITAGGVGLHKFQCCFHPWMRAAVRVTEKTGDEGDDDRH